MPTTPAIGAMAPGTSSVGLHIGVSAYVASVVVPSGSMLLTAPGASRWVQGTGALFASVVDCFASPLAPSWVEALIVPGAGQLAPDTAAMVPTQVACVSLDVSTARMLVVPPTSGAGRLVRCSYSVAVPVGA